MGRPRKLLLIYPYEEDYHLIPVRYCRYVLRRHGYSFKIIEPAKDWRFFYANFYSIPIDYGDIDITLISTLMSIDYLILKGAEFEPDCVLFIAQAPLAKRVFKFFNENDIHTAVWFVDGSLSHEEIPYCNTLFIKKGLPVEEWKDLSFRRIILKGDSLKEQFREIVLILNK